MLAEYSWRYSILGIFEICHFMTIPGLFEYFSEKGSSQKIEVYL